MDGEGKLGEERDKWWNELVGRSKEEVLMSNMMGKTKEKVMGKLC